VSAQNDGETQPIFYAASAAWVALGAPGDVALLLLPAYALLRCAHSWLLIRPRQPARNRVFGCALLILVFVIGDAMRRALAS
jgi:uncharacterized MAPEG superfamily protein